MQSNYNRLIILVFCILLGLSQLCLATEDRRTALVIGNSNYLDAPLRNPVNDATDIAAALRGLGFRVILKTDANQRAMEEAIRSFGRDLSAGGVGLFYFAGHGIQYQGTNYLIPVFAEIKSEADVKFEAVDAGRVLAQMEAAGNNLNIIILDACRNNPFARSFRSAEKGLAKMDAPTGSILAYATAPGSVAADGAGRNGLYTQMLLKHMADPGVELGRLFREVRKKVASASGKKQIPWESSSLMGDWYFNPGRGIVVEQRAAAESSAAVVETGAGVDSGRLERERIQLELERERLAAERQELAALRAKTGQSPGVRSARDIAGVWTSYLTDDNQPQTTIRYFTELTGKEMRFSGHNVFKGKRSGEIAGSITAAGLVTFTDRSVSGAVIKFEGQLKGNRIKGRYTGKYDERELSGQIVMER